MKNRRPALPITLLLIALSAVLLFVLSKTLPSSASQEENTTDAAAQGETTAHVTAHGETAAPYPTGSNTITETEGSTDDITIQDPSAQETTDPFSTLTKEEFFADALFIGDSRTVGLRDYAELETATFFAYSGLSSFSAFKKSLEVNDLGKVTLEELLTARSFGKIYVMLGINELGYPFSSIISKYTQMIEQIHSLQPQAAILLCANLRVVADGKEVRDYIANDTINQLNAQIAALADDQTFFYIDANPLFDDGNGALDPQYCSDDLHPYGKYYYQWAEWLYEIGIPTT